MSLDLLMPKLGLTMTEGILLEWNVAPGESFCTGQPLFVIETDKAATPIEAEVDGMLMERLVEEGEIVPVGTPIGRLVLSGVGVLESIQADAELVSRSNMSEPGASRVTSPRVGGGRVIATPLARRIARERGIDMSTIMGSGPHGRIKVMDLERATAVPIQPFESAPAELGEVRRVRPTPIQTAMARRLSQVKHGVPHFYLATGAEVSALIELRATLNADTALPKLTLTHFVLAAVGRALADHPGINRVWVDDGIVEFSATDVSMAVETDTGLYVPVVRGAGTVSLDQVAVQARAAVEKARTSKLAAADMEGAAIAVSNAGMHDVTWLTPIINAGQSAIIGVASVQEVFRPDAAGAPTLKREMGLVFSGDHRVHTGVEGLAFLNRVRTLLENPVRLLRRA